MSFGVGRYRRGNPPSAAGNYRYVNKRTGKVEYVGDSNDLRRRYQEHLRGAPPAFDPDKHHFDWKEQNPAMDEGEGLRERREKEREKIRQHNPTLNKNRGGGGRTPDRKGSDAGKPRMG